MVFRTEATSSAAQQSHRHEYSRLVHAGTNGICRDWRVFDHDCRSEHPVIAAAADLQFALEEVAAQFKADTGRKVRLGFGASGDFVRQLQQGAPFEMFMSADEGFEQKLADAHLTLGGGSGTVYAEGRVVLFAPKGSALKVDQS
jgi:ABC-type molybdate transport system substrate-binding protein